MIAIPSSAIPNRFILLPPFSYPKNPVLVRSQVHAPGDAGDSVLVHDKEHVDSGDCLRGKAGREDPEPASDRITQPLERKLDVPVSPGEAMGVVIAAQDRNRGDLVGSSCHLDIEMTLVFDFTGCCDDSGTRSGTSVAIEEVRRADDLPVGHAEIGIR